ncbi:hypothetical protein MKW98_014878 [Papaver atlanticum]|uniref:poly(A)-specific ribonuclease n=1 Tax=Papaver atlanticum TaxID=357466 RepID=A0AAD4XE09_9MAGN|nr:hypothetical protein MKW98_014878 [Papaver atlanticum]
MATAAKTLAKPVKIVEVFSENCETEFQRICAALTRYPIISMDTEFPGVIFKSNVQTLDKKQTPFEYYQIMKKNIDALKLIQVGLTLSDAQGNLPDFGTYTCIWQFNLSDFDVSKDLCAADSIELLKKQGINFEKNRREGIDSRVFARMLLQYGVVCNPVAAAAHFFYKYSLNWITFHSGYDFGYLIKLLIYPDPLPTRLEDFMCLVKRFFGTRVYDIKHMMKFCQGLFGGLENVSKVLGAERKVGNCHQAGSDSLLTLKTFVKMYAKYFTNQDIHTTYGGALHDLIFQADVQIRSNYGMVVQISRSYDANMYPYNCHLYIKDFPVYSNLIN